MLFLAILSCYLIGSIPTAYILGRLLKGIDIREHGSGNVGATNVFRVLGKGPGIFALVCDILKGTLAVVICSALFQITDVVHLLLLCGAAVCGHNWTIFLKFKGGKGVATTLGVLIALAIKITSLQSVLLITVGVWIAFFLIFGYVSLASIAAGIAFPALMLTSVQPASLRILALFLGIFLIYRHKTNILRLKSGTEPKVPVLWHKARKNQP